jgi:hypothetical protein
LHKQQRQQREDLDRKQAYFEQIDQQIRDDARTRQDLNQRIMQMRIRNDEAEEIDRELKLQCALCCCLLLLLLLRPLFVCVVVGISIM